MANLIITVISIALVAVAALMGAYYGGQAFMDGQTNAAINTTIEQAKQIKTAYLLYLNNGNDRVTGNPALGGLDPFTSKTQYLTAVPKPPSTVLEPTNPTWYIFSLTAFGNAAGYYPQAVWLRIKDEKICTKIAKTFSGVAEMGIRQGGDTTYQNYKDSQNRGLLDRLRTFGGDCYLNDNDADHVYSSPDQMYFLLMID